MKGSLIILFFFCSGVLLARMGLIPTYLVEHDFTIYALWLLMLLVGISIGSDRRLGEILLHSAPSRTAAAAGNHGGHICGHGCS